VLDIQGNELVGVIPTPEARQEVGRHHGLNRIRATPSWIFPRPDLNEVDFFLEKARQ
jgi:hypothetical protein